MRIVGDPDEALAIGALLGVDLAHEDLVGVEPELGHRRAQLLEGLRVRRAAVPEQQLDPWLRHGREARGSGRLGLSARVGGDARRELHHRGEASQRRSGRVRLRGRPWPASVVLLSLRLRKSTLAPRRAPTRRAPLDPRAPGHPPFDDAVRAAQRRNRHGQDAYGTTTAAPSIAPPRTASSAASASSSAKVVTWVRTGTRGARSRNSTRVGAREVGHRAQHALAPEDLVGEGRGCRSCGCPRRRRRRRGPPRAAPPARARPTGAKMIAASSSSGAGPSASPAHSHPSSQREGLRGVVVGAGEGEDAPALVARDLADDVRAGAEAVEPEALRVAGHPQRAVADEPAHSSGAASRSPKPSGSGEGVARVGHRAGSRSRRRGPGR